jgi:hypothetical protein
VHSLEETEVVAASPGEAEDAAQAFADPTRRIWPRLLRIVLLVAFSQYLIIALGVGLSLAATLRYYVTPQLLATFEAITKALKP